MALWELLCPTPTELGTYYIRTLLKTSNVSVGCKLKKLSRIGTRYGLHIWQFTSSTCGFNHVLIHSIMWLENSPYVYVSGLMSSCMHSCIYILTPILSPLVVSLPLLPRRELLAAVDPYTVRSTQMSVERTSRPWRSTRIAHAPSWHRGSLTIMSETLRMTLSVRRRRPQMYRTSHPTRSRPPKRKCSCSLQSWRPLSTDSA